MARITAQAPSEHSCNAFPHAGALLADLATVLRSTWQRMPPQVGICFVWRAVGRAIRLPACLLCDPHLSTHNYATPPPSAARMQSMSMVLHSFALQRFTPHELLDVAAEHLAEHMPEYSPQVSKLSSSCAPAAASGSLLFCSDPDPSSTAGVLSAVKLSPVYAPPSPPHPALWMAGHCQRHVGLWQAGGPPGAGPASRRTMHTGKQRQGQAAAPALVP